MFAPIRRALVKQVRSTFNDQSRGEKPGPASDQALFPPGSVIRRVHGDVTSMMVGGIAALLTQMLHPKA
ncbi:MAG TPA: oxygenase MpaB family protein, partial [Sphingomicrobium sp.]|nr:oxygenase MpaB family protein [Sphingomicrobium sp.]